MAEEYQGWTNRETWAVNLHLSNDEHWYNLTWEMAEQAVTEAEGDRDEAIFKLAESLEVFVQDGFHEHVFYPSYEWPRQKEWRLMAADVGSLWRVNWSEIAEDAYILELMPNES